MNNKRMFLIGLGVLLVFGLLVIVLKTTSQSSSSNPVHLATISNENKIYTVQEVVDILKSNRTVLKDKSIQLEAFVVDAVEGLGCQDYQIITDKEYVQTFKNRYDNKLSQEERFNAILQSKLAPVLQTGEALTVPEGFFPTYHAIYQGHFYDPKMTKNCDADAFKKFVIERKVKEIVATKQSNYRTKTFSTGIIIANGKYLQRPYEVTLKDYKVTVNGVLYEPATEEQVNKITEFTDDQRLKQWESLTSVLEKNGLVIYGGNKYEFTKGSYPSTFIADIDTLMKSDKSAQQRRVELARLLDTFPDDPVMNDILKNW